MVDISLLSIEYPASDILLATNNLNPGNLLGTGTYGSVYRGVLKDGTEVAVKVLDAVDLSGFEEEIQVLSRFRHPNLVILLGFARSGNKRFLIYELLAGGDVYKKLKSPDFPWNQRLSILLDAACGLSHLLNSQPRCYHRDIKSSNILLDRNGTGKMADFGLSCLNSNSASTSMRVSQASGTVGYACPLYISKGVVSEASEVYSFGMVMVELLTGMAPARQGRDLNDIVYLVNHIAGDIKRLLGLLDRRARWPLQIAQPLGELALLCSSFNEAVRPRFIEIVNRLRALTTKTPTGSSQRCLSPTASSLGSQAPAAHSFEPAVAAKPLSPPMPVASRIPAQPAPPAFVDGGSSAMSPPFRVFFARPASGHFMDPGPDGVLVFGRQAASVVGLPAELQNMISREHVEIAMVDHRMHLANRGRNQIEVEVATLASPFFLTSGEQVSLPAGEFQVRFVTGIYESSRFECFLALRVEVPNRMPVARLEIVSRGPQEEPLEVFEGGTALVESEESPLFQVTHEPELFTSGFSVKALFQAGISLCSVSKTSKSMKSFYLRAGERTHIDADDYVRVNENLVFQFKLSPPPGVSVSPPPGTQRAASPVAKYLVPENQEGLGFRPHSRFLNS